MSGWHVHGARGTDLAVLEPDLRVLARDHLGVEVPVALSRYRLRVALPPDFGALSQDYILRLERLVEREEAQRWVRRRRARERGHGSKARAAAAAGKRL